MKVDRLLAAGVGLVAVITVAFAGCGGDDDNGATATSGADSPTQAGGVPSNLTKVMVSDNKFTPGSLQLPVGATVTWEWSGSAPHSVVGEFDGEQVQSPRLTGSGTYQQTFEKAGVLEYQCGVHGEAMSGTIRIQ